MAIFGQKSKVIRPAKIFCGAHTVTLSHDEILTNGFFRVNYGTLQMWIAASREQIAQRAASYWQKLTGPIYFFMPLVQL
jgi:hypothetical protein